MKLTFSLGVEKEGERERERAVIYIEKKGVFVCVIHIVN